MKRGQALNPRSRQWRPPAREAQRPAGSAAGAELAPLYGEPLLYDLAFGWCPEIEVEFYEEVFREHADGASRILELGCGTGRLMVELAKRGYLVDGIDLSIPMVRHARAKFERLGLWNAEAFVGDMAKFSVRPRYDAALCVLNTFSHLLTHGEARSHLECVAEALRRGGVYCIDLTLAGRASHRWMNEVLGVVAHCEWRREGGEGVVEESYRLVYVWPDGTVRVLSGSLPMRAWTSREVIELVDGVEELEVAACYKGFNTGRRVELSKASGRVQVVLRKI